MMLEKTCQAHHRSCCCSGGQGGGTPNANNQIACIIQYTILVPTIVGCFAPGTPVPAAGGTSFASGMVSSAVFQLGPQGFPVGGLGQQVPNPLGNGYVQVVRLG